MHWLLKGAICLGVGCVSVFSLVADSDVYLLGVPDYDWYAGCFGTACGNLMGYWDRHGMDDFYTGPTAGGVAPMNDGGSNIGIRSMWASKAGFDGAPTNKFGHIDDYWQFYYNDFSFSYQSTLSDAYVIAGRPEHEPNCVGDFIGLSQKKWTNQNGECDGNIDAYSFVYWDTNGERRLNYSPTAAAGSPGRDIQSGLRAWAKYRGYDADVFTQLSDFNPHTPAGKGFTFEDLKAEIDRGYPVLVFLQDYNQYSRSLSGMPKANPEIHGMCLYGYQEFPDFGLQTIYARTSWGSGDNVHYGWTATPWVFDGPINLAVRGVIGFHPKPKLRSVVRSGKLVTLSWDGPSSQVYDAAAHTTNQVHRYQIERSSTLPATVWTSVASPTTERTLTFADCCEESGFFRVRLLGPGE